MPDKPLPGVPGMDHFRRLIWRDTGADPGPLTKDQRYAAKLWYHGENYGTIHKPKKDAS